MDQRLRWPVIADSAVGLEQDLQRPRQTETLTLECEKAQIIGGIENTLSAIKFEAIDDHRLGFEQEYMFRPQVIVRLNKKTIVDPRFDQTPLPMRLGNRAGCCRMQLICR